MQGEGVNQEVYLGAIELTMVKRQRPLPRVVNIDDLLTLAKRRLPKAVFDYLIFQSEGPALEHLPPSVQGLFGDLTQAKVDRIRSILLKSLTRKAP